MPNPNNWSSLGVGAATGAASSLASGAFNTLFGGVQMRRQKELMQEQYRQQVALTEMQNKRQDFLNANAMLMQKQGALKAGVNPNFQDGPQANTSSSTASVSASPSAPGVQVSPFDMLQGAALNEDLKIKQAQRHSIELANQQKQNELNAYDEVQSMLRILNDESHNGLELSTVDGRTLHVAFNTPEALDAFNKYIHASRDVTVAEAEKSQSNLKKFVADYQGANKTIIESMANMPVKEYALLNQKVAETISKTDLNNSQKDLNISTKNLNDLKNEILHDNRLSNLVEVVFGHKFDLEKADLTDKLIYIFMIFFASRYGGNW